MLIYLIGLFQNQIISLISIGKLRVLFYLNEIGFLGKIHRKGWNILFMNPFVESQSLVFLKKISM